MRRRCHSIYLSSRSKHTKHTVVLLRHGQSIWNVEKRFTGWCDVPLTTHGHADARDAGRLLGERGLKFDIAFTSKLERAWKTCESALAYSGQPHVPIIHSCRLNERHYGILQGHYKDCQLLSKAFGEENIIQWRKSFHDSPPSLADVELLTGEKKAAYMESLQTWDGTYSYLHRRATWEDVMTELGEEIDTSEEEYYEPPETESLKQCQDRAFGYWKDVIAPCVKQGKRVLVVAHANAIRALVKAIDDIDDKMISHLKIPNGIPLVYTLDRNLHPILDYTDDLGFQAKYLVSARNHAKMMEYERSVRKKLVALFEYLDTDHDNRITKFEIEKGLTRLKTYKNVEQICEFEIEELLRCVPEADERGGVTLEAFLNSEATLLPKLSKLRLLQ